MNNIDFISEKWRTVGRTRRLAYIHLASFAFPILYVATYAEAQRRAGDSKELGAALAALMFNTIQLARTFIGIVQLNAFVQWCKHGVECIRALLGADEEGDERGEDAESADNMEDVEENVKLNNGIVDNELGGRDVTVLPSLHKLWNEIRRGEFRPSSWLVTDQPGLSTVRWCGAFLCGLGNYWSVDKNNWGGADEILAAFFSKEHNEMRETLQNVTWNVGASNDDTEVVSIAELENMDQNDLSGETITAYGTPLCHYNLCNTSTVDSFSFEFDSLVGSYPASGGNYDSGNRKKVDAVGLAHSVLLAKQFGVDKLKAIRTYYERYRLPTDKTLHKAFKLYLQQLGKQLPNDSKMWLMFQYPYWQIPIFPYRMQMVSLWDEDTNWRVLQISAHQDLIFSLDITWIAMLESIKPPFEMEPRPRSIFDFSLNCTQNVAKQAKVSTDFLGVFMETVRSFLAEWVAFSPLEPQWQPMIPTDVFEFQVNENRLAFLHDEKSLIWTCLNALQRDLARNSVKNRYQNLPSNCALMMLRILSFPGLNVLLVDETNATSREMDDDIEVLTKTSSSAHCKVNLDVTLRVVRVYPAPQDISVFIRIDWKTRTLALSLNSGRDEDLFEWQEWIDAGMGCFKAWNKRDGAAMSYKRTVVRGDLREPMVEFCPLRDDGNGNVGRTDTARIWMGWPVFDVNICKFEVEQWLTACGINVNTSEDKFEADREVERCERLLQAIVKTESI